MTREQKLRKVLDKVLWTSNASDENKDVLVEAIVEALEPEPRKGHWIGKGYFITCSCCNEMSYPFDYGGYGSIYHDFCPNCGADMREVEK